MNHKPSVLIGHPNTEAGGPAASMVDFGPAGQMISNIGSAQVVDD